MRNRFLCGDMYFLIGKFHKFLCILQCFFKFTISSVLYLSLSIARLSNLVASVRCVSICGRLLPQLDHRFRCMMFVDLVS
jgi:hypothetical protein